MRILIAGGDGFCGWPTSLHLSAAGHEVVLIDNLMRRRWDEELHSGSLTPIAELQQRVAVWQQYSGRSITAEIVDLTDEGQLFEVIARVRPEATVHFAEQSSAPYSMIDASHAVATQVNNVVGTLNLLFAIRDFAPDCHLVKLGTMGEYGTPDIDIEEGYIEIEHNGRCDVLPYPKQPGSFYHLSKVHDSDNILFACRTWGLRATDLNQGIVYNVQTEHTAAHPGLVNRYDYDAVFGTVLNRFCVQTALGGPLTVYGEGGQTRGFIDLRDTVRCIELAIETPPPAGQMRVMNQFTQQFSVAELAALVAKVAARKGIEVEIRKVGNPRVERERHYYKAAHSALVNLGLKPHLMSEETIERLISIAIEHRGRARKETILPSIRWRDGGAMHSPVRVDGEASGEAADRLEATMRWRRGDSAAAGFARGRMG